MQRQQLIADLLKTRSKKIHRRLLKKHADLIDLRLAEEIKNTYYDSWTREPLKTRNAAQALEILSEIIPDGQVKALAVWVKGIADLAEGQTEKAIINLDKAAQIFTASKKPYQAAQTQVSKLYALALLGRYDEAIEYGKTALKIFKKYGDELAVGKIEHNIGNLFYRREIYETAKQHFQKAHKFFSKVNDVNQLTMIENNIAAACVGENDFREAEKFYNSALLRARETKMLVTEAEIEAQIGNLATFRGKFDQALNFLESSRQKFETLKMPHQMLISELEMADIYLELNLTEEAFSIYEKIANHFKKLKMQGEEARARANFGRAAARLNKNKIAKTHLKRSAQLYMAEKNKIGAAVVKITAAGIELSEQRFDKSLMIVKEIQNLLSEGKNIRQKLSLNWLESETLVKLKMYDEAEKILKKILIEAEKHEQPNVSQMSLNSLGRLALQTNNQTRAKKYFEQAIDIIEKLRAPLPAEEFQMAFLADKLAPYQNLAKIYLAENKLEEAFLQIEKARARSLAENLENNLPPDKNFKVADPLREKLENVREELNWFYSRLTRAEDTEVEKLQDEIRHRERQIADMMRRIESTNTARKQTKDLSNDFSGIEKLQNNLGEQTALVEFVNFEGNLSAFVITNENIEYVSGLASEKAIIEMLEGLRFQFGGLRYGADNLDGFMPDLKKRADFYLRKIYEKLIKPIRDIIQRRDLIIVPVGVLNYIPFQALSDGENYLVETREITYSPSAAIWQILRNREKKKLTNALLFGFADERIPLVETEIKNLEEVFGESKVFIGEHANFKAFVKNAPHFDVLHLACHGQFRADNPLFSSLHLADGFITVRDICSQKLNAELVTLSACETGLNKIFAGNEILGLARGFLLAGVSSLVLSLWTVSDQATIRLMKKFYRNLQRGDSISASLAKAQREFIKENAHPYYWAPFVLIGK